MEKRGCLKGRWIEAPGQRRRRCYGITTEGRKVLAAQRNAWQDFIGALDRVAGIQNA